MTDHPITPPPELVEEWASKSARTYRENGTYAQHELHLAAQAARWGADQELEACCKYMQHEDFHGFATELRAARRPSPTSLKGQALEALQSMQIDPVVINGVNINADVIAKYDTIRRALNQLPNE